MFKSLFLVMALVATPLWAEPSDHGLSTIEGPGIDLKTEGHAFAGVINGHLAFGDFNHDTFVSKLVVYRNEARSEVSFQMSESKTLEGTLYVSSQDADTQATHVRFVKVLGQTQEIAYEVNGEKVLVKISSTAFDGKHFVNPTYTAQLGGKEFQFTLNGKACYGYSVHLNLMILSAFKAAL